MSTSGYRILVVEDESTIADILTDYLRRAGYVPTRLEDGAEAVELVRADPPDLIILDIMLPGLDGISVCRQVRTFSAVPIIMVTARVEEIDRLLGLEVGADDYVCKPFSPREVISRVGTVLRRSARPLADAPAASRLTVDETSQRVMIDGQRLELTPTEFRLMALLARRPGRIYTRAQILELAYGDDQDVSDRIIDSHIKNIRKKLSQLLPDTEVIHAVYGVGYRFEF
jgi:two-component system response regulator BaeR